MKSLPQEMCEAYDRVAAKLSRQNLDHAGRAGAGARVLAVLSLTVLLAGVCGIALGQGAVSAIHGRVTDARGAAVADAKVRLERGDANTAAEATSGKDGGFAFEGVSAGTYAVIAEKGGVRSAAVQAVVPGGTLPQALVLVLGGQPRAAAQAMEFADSPNFTIAGVRDWTAAGGHGSDVSLRTSEALNREAVGLKADGSAAGTLNPAAEAHREAGIKAEANGDPLKAVQEFAAAVREDPSEQNYFAWGSELLVHRAVIQAKEVFEQGVKLYPKSSRLLTSLGAALFAGAFYEESAERLCEASDLDPRNPEPYQFMGKIEVVAPHFDSCMDARLARYAELAPNDSLANYFYAMDLWRAEGPGPDAETRQKVESLLTKAVAVDAKCSDGYLQLGNLKSSEKNYATAVGFYEKAIATDPESSEAHYRLGMAYDRLGEKDKAKAEFAAHDAINKRQAAETERERKAVKQFVVEAEKRPQ